MGMARNRPVTEYGMTEIVVTQAAVRKLAAELSTANTSQMSHGDRLNLISSAFGWRADAFMHALKVSKKSKNAEQVQKVIEDRLADPHWGVPLALQKLGIRDLREWKEAAAQPSGVLIVAGAPRSGRHQTLGSTARHLQKSGRLVHVGVKGLISDNASPGDVVLYGPIRDKSDALEAYGLAARGFLVLVMMSRLGADNFQDLLEYGVAEESLELTRAIIQQVLIMKLAPRYVRRHLVDGDERRYDGMTLTSHVQVFGERCSVQEYRGRDNPAAKGFMNDLLFKVGRQVTDIVEIERVLGEGFASAVKAVIANKHHQKA
jgi:type II secretory ATPase GspE/PulE/Tfp pilus assembly ATPase PilB-like protein